VETTGLNVVRDRIVQIALDQTVQERRCPPPSSVTLVNPGIPDLRGGHGRARHYAQGLGQQAHVSSKWPRKSGIFIGDADLAGYNSNRFDVPMLMEEFARVGMEFDVSKRRLIDVQRIFYKMEPRTLKAAYRLYCGKELTDAHDRIGRCESATLEVFQGQLTTYEGKDLIDEDGNVHSSAHQKRHTGPARFYQRPQLPRRHPKNSRATRWYARV
jgi:DNA polymerase-3 subunit epsilon